MILDHKAKGQGGKDLNRGGEYGGIGYNGSL